MIKEKRKVKEDVSTFLSVFFKIFPCNTVHLWMCLFVLFVFTVGLMGTGSDLSSPHFHSRLWALTLKPKTRQISDTEMKKPCNCCVFYRRSLEYTLSRLFNNDFTKKTVFIIWKDKEYLFTRETACVWNGTSRRRTGTRQGRVSLYLCACTAASEGNNGIALSQTIVSDNSLYNHSSKEGAKTDKWKFMLKNDYMSLNEERILVDTRFSDYLRCKHLV